MRRKNRSVLPLSRKTVILIITLSAVFHGVLFAQERPLLVFTDNDSRGGLISGDLIFTVPHTDFREWAIEMPCIDRMRTKYIFDGWGIVRNVPEGVIVHGTGKPNHR